MEVFKFKKFDILQTDKLHKVGTDSLILGAFACHKSVEKILDIGTGTGVLSLMSAQKYPNAAIFAIDIDRKAVELASENFKNSNFSNTFNLIKGDFLELKTSVKFDLIISNPPFYSTDFLPLDEQKKLAKHEMSFTLPKLILKSMKLLNDTGSLWLIAPYERLKEVKYNSQLFPFLIHNITIFGKKDKPNRSIMIFSKDKKLSVTAPKSLVIRNEYGSYTETYKNLTSDFHFNKL